MLHRITRLATHGLHYDRYCTIEHRTCDRGSLTPRVRATSTSTEESHELWTHTATTPTGCPSWAAGNAQHTWERGRSWKLKTRGSRILKIEEKRSTRKARFSHRSCPDESPCVEHISSQSESDFRSPSISRPLFSPRSGGHRWFARYMPTAMSEPPVDVVLARTDTRRDGQGRAIITATQPPLRVLQDRGETELICEIRFSQITRS